jgi:hypothetical protein
MNKFSKIVKAFFLLLRKPRLINHILDSNEACEEEFRKQFPEVNPNRQISLKSIYNFDDSITITPFSFLSGSSLITDFVLLKLACLRTQATDYFEIGTWRGESVANVSSLVKNCYTLNLSDEQLTALGFSKNYIDSHRFFSKEKENVTHLFGDSKTYDFSDLNNKFDVIFIDGDHHTDAVESDTSRLFTYLKSNRSIIVWHDAKKDTETIRFEVLLGIYRGIPKDKHKNIYLVENTLCAIYLDDDINFDDLICFDKPEHNFAIDIQIKFQK